MADFASVFAVLFDVVHMFRVELGFLASFALLWFLSPSITSKTNSKASGSKVVATQASKPSADATARRRTQPPSPSTRSVSKGGIYSASTTVDLRSPSPWQLCDAKWVVAAVQRLCPTQVQKAIDLYRSAVRSGLDLQSMPATDAAPLFMALVTSAIRVGQIDEVLRLLRDCRSGSGTSPALLASCTKLCTSKQLFKECLSIFDFLSDHPAVVIEDGSVWSCLLFSAVEARAYNRCQFFFERLKRFGAPTSKDYGNMIRCVGAQGNWQIALALIREMRQAALEVDSVVYNTALATCVAANKTDEARLLLDEMETSTGVADVITYNTLSKGYAKVGKLDQCFDLFRHMRSRGITPSQISYGILLDSCINEKQMEKAIEVFDEMTAQGLVMNTILYTTLIKGFARAEQVGKAMGIYEQMCNDRDKSISPDLITFSILIKANCDAGRLEDALVLLSSMIDLRLCPDEVIFNNLLGGCIRDSRPELAKGLYNNMVEGGVRPSNATFSILIRLYAQNKLLDEAVEMLKTEPKTRGVEPEPRLYLQLAQACLRERQGRRAVEVYKCMLEHGPPTVAAHGSLLGLCTKLNMLDTAAEILVLAAETGGRVDMRDAMQIKEMAARKRKSSCVETVASAMKRLGIEPALAS